MPYRENPAWADRVLRDAWPRLVANVPADLLPVPDRIVKKTQLPHRFAEYGCGAYGCVLPVARKGIVCKVTGDETEVKFVSLYKDLAEEPDGVVRYLPNAVQVGGAVHSRRKVYLIWREEAHDVGLKFNTGLLANNDVGRITTGLNLFKTLAAEIRKYLAEDKPGAQDRMTKVRDRWQYGERAAQQIMDHPGWAYDVYRRIAGIKNPDKAAVCRTLCIRAAQLLRNVNGAESVGYALESLLYQDILLADVHTNNVGFVDREAYSDPLLVITDPGHAALLDPAKTWDRPGVI